MNKLSWCLKVKNGIELIVPNERLADAYLKKAEESLETMKAIASKEWKITTAYYGMYFSIYAILMKIGMKCEIHRCTIEFVKRFLSQYFNREEILSLSTALQARIDMQYYTNRKLPENLIENIGDKAREFYLKCKSIVQVINEKETAAIRNRLQANDF